MLIAAVVGMQTDCALLPLFFSFFLFLFLLLFPSAHSAFFFFARGLKTRRRGGEYTSYRWLHANDVFKWIDNKNPPMYASIFDFWVSGTGIRDTPGCVEDRDYLRGRISSDDS